jgi:hypothetical protein
MRTKIITAAVVAGACLLGLQTVAFAQQRSGAYPLTGSFGSADVTAAPGNLGQSGRYFDQYGQDARCGAGYSFYNGACYAARGHSPARD